MGRQDNGIGTGLQADDFSLSDTFETWDFGVWYLDSDAGRPRLLWEVE